MTYREIMRDFYYRYRKGLMAYIGFCIFISIVLFGLNQMDLAFGTGRVIKTLGGSFGQTIAPIAGATLLLGMDPPSGVLVMSIMSAILEYVPADAIHSFGEVIGLSNLETMSNYTFGLFDFNAVRIFCLIWFIISKIPKSTRVTLPFGLTFEDIESKMGVVVVAAVIIVQFLKIVPLGDNIVEAASFNNDINDVVNSGFNAVTSFMVMIVFVTIYGIMRLSAYFIDIVVMPITGSTPFVAFIMELTKTIFTAVLCWIYFVHPEVFYVLFFVILLIAVLLFRTAYIAVRFFKGIYSKPISRRIKAKIKKQEINMSLTGEKLKKSLRKALIAEYGAASDGNPDVNFIIPVFLQAKINVPAKTRKRDIWYWINKDGESFLVKKPAFKNTLTKIRLTATDERMMFINKTIAYIEVFNMKKGQENIGYMMKLKQKGINLIMSSEYNSHYEEIKAFCGFTDYKEYKNLCKDAIKKEKELIKAEKAANKKSFSLFKKEVEE